MLVSNISKSLKNHINNPFLENPGYDTGLLGISLFYTLLYDYKNDNNDKNIAEEYFEKGLYSIQNNFSPTYLNDTLDSHIGQIGRFVYFIKNHQIFTNFDFDDYLTDLDNIASQLYPSKIENKDFDITSGALATGSYFTLRDSDIANHSLKDILLALNKRKNIYEGDKYYWVSPSLNNRIYLGISHGSAMIINFLLKIYEKNIYKDLCLDLIKGASYYLLYQMRKLNFIGLFDNFVGEDKENKQFSLCYGDLGNGIILYKAGIILNDDELINKSKEILDDCLLRKFEDNLTLDASVLYGASGISIAFQEIYNITKDTKFMERSNYWLESISKYNIYNNEYSGFKSRLLDQSPLWDLSFGWGILGIGSTLINNKTHSFYSLSPLTFLY